MEDNDRMDAKKTTRTTQPTAELDGRNQLARVRTICNEIPGILEKVSHGMQTFFTPKRVFVMFADNHHDDGHLAIWIPAAPSAQEAAIEEAADIYFRPPYVGVSGWVGVKLAKVDDERLGALIREAFRFVSIKKPLSQSAKRTARDDGRERRHKARVLRHVGEFAVLDARRFLHFVQKFPRKAVPSRPSWQPC
jgi:hypothetical protein